MESKSFNLSLALMVGLMASGAAQANGVGITDLAGDMTEGHVGVGRILAALAVLGIPPFNPHFFLAP